MAYKDKEKEREIKRKWYQENQDRVQASRERYNEKRRQERRDPEVLAVEARRKRMRRLNMTEEEYAVFEQERLEQKRKYHREWNRAHANKGRYAKIKERMAQDPEYAAKMREQQARANAKRRSNRDETPEEREKRLQKAREYDAKRRREKRLMAQLVPGLPKQVKPKAPPPPPKPKAPPVVFRRKPGRLLALAGWNGF